MASEITNMLPFRQYNDNDVVNMFALEDASTSIGAGTVGAGAIAADQMGKNKKKV